MLSRVSSAISENIQCDGLARVGSVESDVPSTPRSSLSGAEYYSAMSAAANMARQPTQQSMRGGRLHRGMIDTSIGVAASTVAQSLQSHPAAINLSAAPPPPSAHSYWALEKARIREAERQLEGERLQREWQARSKLPQQSSKSQRPANDDVDSGQLRNANGQGTAIMTRLSRERQATNGAERELQQQQRVVQQLEAQLRGVHAQLKSERQAAQARAEGGAAVEYECVICLQTAAFGHHCNGSHASHFICRRCLL